MHWRLKAAAFSALSAIPLGKQMHFQLQRRVTHSWPRPRADVLALLGCARQTLADCQRFGGGTGTSQAAFCEIGSGRDLCVPLALRMMGASRVVAIDIERLASLDLINHTAQLLAAELNTAVPGFGSWEELQGFGVEYVAPTSSLARAGVVDAFVSNEVLEHVPRDALPGLLAAGRQILRPGGLAIHAIDYSDHFARGSALSRFNFLRYPERAWRKYNSRLQHVSRLRHSEYLELFDRAGFDILEANAHSGIIPPEIQGQLAPEFRRFDLADLAVMRSRIIARRRG